MESIPLHQIQKYFDLVYFQISQNQNYEFLYLKLVMRSILPTDQKELVSLAAFKGAKIKPIPQSFQQNTNDHFSENILLL
jgi:hypothetical protein